LEETRLKLGQKTERKEGDLEYYSPRKRKEVILLQTCLLVYSYSPRKVNEEQDIGNGAD